MLLLTLLGLSVFCLQETFLKTDDNFTVKGFNVYNHIHCDCASASGGRSILVKSSLPQREIKLKANLQAKLFLCQTSSKTPKTGFFSRRGSIIVEFWVKPLSEQETRPFILTFNRCIWSGKNITIHTQHYLLTWKPGHYKPYKYAHRLSL